MALKLLMRTLTLTFVCVCIVCKLIAQTCPVNIDLSTGTFANWQCYTGTTDEKMVKGALTNFIYLTPTALPVKNVHTLIPAKTTDVDKYGKFPIAAPNGGAYSVKLGSTAAGKQAEGMSYTFDVPEAQENFVLTYYYAAVLQTANHWPEQQSRFLAKVYNITDNAYVSCAAAEYVTTANLPGFQKSTVDAGVVFKPWSPVTLNLSAYRGKKLRLEFTAAGCTQSGHFGYAYVAISSACSNLITGLDYCSSDAKVILTGPGGYAGYKWYNADRSKILSTDNKLVFSTPPPNGTQVSVDLTPFPGFGCVNTAVATLRNHGPSLQVTNPEAVCQPATVDITSAQVVTTNGINVNVTYWKDAATTVPLESPKALATSGTYYVKAASGFSCTEVKPVMVTIHSQPELRVTNPNPICQGTGTLDVTAAAVTAGSTGFTSLTYWLDAAATRQLEKPSAVSVSGVYYIKAVNALGCASIKPVSVLFYQLPELSVADPAAVCYPATIDLTNTFSAKLGDNLHITYWKDAAATISLNNFTQVGTSGIYYIKATSIYGCETLKPVKVTINALPELVVNKPADVCIPARVDLSMAAITAGSNGIKSLSYWRDENATIPLAKHTAVADSGLYYIKAVNASGCSIVKPVLVSIHQLPVVKINQPKALYQPKTIDLTKTIDASRSTGNATNTYWADAALTLSVANPKAVSQSGTYYVKASNVYGCYSVAPIEVFLAPVADIVVPTAFTPLQATNNKLYPFSKGLKSFTFFRIYNRWGNVVYETKEASPEKGWDGNFKGTIAVLDTFTWVAEGYDYLGNLVHRSGNTVLLK